MMTDKAQPDAKAHAAALHVGNVPERTTVEVCACSAWWTTLELVLEASTMRVSGPPGNLVALGRNILDAVVLATDSLGKRCAICGRRGLNDGEFALPFGGAYAHVGCLEDHRHAERGADADHGLDA
jgi:hypothetical protein